MRFSTIMLAGGALALGAMGCRQTMAPKELADARTQYARTSTGAAATETPAEVHAAKTALDEAERSFADHGDSPVVRDKAYVAMRKAQFADSAANAEIALKAKAALDIEGQRLQSARLESTTDALEKTQDALGREQIARADAEKKAAQAMADLQKLAAVKQEPRGMVITLSGSVLFATNESTLLPAAVVKLNEVADALIKSNPDSEITIEGHTDSQGTHDHNMTLGQQRADAVKTQLVSHGVAADRIKAVGVGPDRPIADNKSAEGRANNRRVEIVVAKGNESPGTRGEPRSPARPPR